MERAHPVDDELDADDEDQKAHDAHDRADSGGTQLVDPGRAVAQQQRDDGGSYRDSQDDADMKTDGRVAGGQRDNHADRAGMRGSAMGEKDTSGLEVAC